MSPAGPCSLRMLEQKPSGIMFLGMLPRARNVEQGRKGGWATKAFFFCLALTMAELDVLFWHLRRPLRRDNRG